MDFEPLVWFREGGIFMYPIALSGLVSISIGLERLVFLYFRASVHASALLSRVQRDVLDQKLDAALAVCNADAPAVLARVLKAGLTRAGRPASEVRDALDEAILGVTPTVTQRISHLSTAANVATLLGLLGTIQGLILSFHAVSDAGAEARSVALAQGIAVAMYTTFAGLLVAIPTLVVHSLIAAKANAILDDVDHGAQRLLNLLVSTQHAGS